MKKYDKERILEIASFIVLGGIILFISINTAEAKKLVGYIINIVNPIIYAAAIAFIVNLLVKPIEKAFITRAKKKNKEIRPRQYRTISIILAFLIFIAFIALAVGMIIPNLSSTVSNLYKSAPALWDKFLDAIDKFKIKQPKLAGIITTAETSLDNLFDKIVNKVKTNFSDIAGTVLSKVKSLSNVLFNFFVGAIIAIGVIAKKEFVIKEFRLILQKLLPSKHYRRTTYVLKLANKKFQIFFKYNIVQAVITGAGTFLVMLVSGMPYKASIPLLITVTQLIPVIGAVVGTVISAILILPVSPVKAIIFVVLCTLVQQIVEKLINPHLMGKELDMPGLLTFLAIIIGGKQFGFIGLICAVPFVSVLYDIYKLQIHPMLTNKKTERSENK